MKSGTNCSTNSSADTVMQNRRPLLFTVLCLILQYLAYSAAVPGLWVCCRTSRSHVHPSVLVFPLHVLNFKVGERHEAT
jgi:hypothetical protein